jgi:hypothetical protein
MSDRLAISASFPVLMMALYVLFGDNVQRVPFGPLHSNSEITISADVKTPELPRNPGDFLTSLD